MYICVYVCIGNKVIYGSLKQMIDMREAELDTAGRQRICGDRQMYLLLYIYREK